MHHTDLLRRSNAYTYIFDECAVHTVWFVEQVTMHTYIVVDALATALGGGDGACYLLQIKNSWQSSGWCQTVNTVVLYCTVAQFGVGAVVVVVLCFLSFHFTKTTRPVCEPLKDILFVSVFSLSPLCVCVCECACIHVCTMMCYFWASHASIFMWMMTMTMTENMRLFVLHSVFVYTLTFGVRYLFIYSTFVSVPPLTIIISSLHWQDFIGTLTRLITFSFFIIRKNILM